MRGGVDYTGPDRSTNADAVAPVDIVLFFARRSGRVLVEFHRYLQGGRSPNPTILSHHRHAVKLGRKSLGPNLSWQASGAGERFNPGILPKLRTVAS